MERADQVLARIELDRRRLRAEALLEELNPVEAEERAFLPPGGRARLKRSAYLLRLAGLDLERGDPRRAQYLRAAAEIFENIAGGTGSAWAQFEARSQASACWSLGGYQANAIVMSRQVRSEFVADTEAVTGPSTTDFYRIASAILERDLVRLEWRRHP